MKGTEWGAGTGGGPIEGEGVSKLGPSEPVDPTDGYWPKWWAKYLNDWRTAKNAKANDGLVAPEFARPGWLDNSGAASDIVLEAARLRHEKAEERIEKAEERSHRIVRSSLSLMTLGLLVSGFMIERLRALDTSLFIWMGGVAVAAVPVGCLALAAIEALGVDRVGFVQPPEPGRAAKHEAAQGQRRDLVEQEYLATQMANWTARHKLREFLQARAWLTRGITTLAVLAVLAGGILVFTDQPVTSSPEEPRTVSEGLEPTTSLPEFTGIPESPSSTVSP